MFLLLVAAFKQHGGADSPLSSLYHSTLQFIQDRLHLTDSAVHMDVLLEASRTALKHKCNGRQWEKLNTHLFMEQRSMLIGDQALTKSFWVPLNAGIQWETMRLSGVFSTHENHLSVYWTDYWTYRNVIFVLPKNIF